MGAIPGRLVAATLLLSGYAVTTACAPAGASRSSGDLHPSGTATSAHNPARSPSGGTSVLAQYRRFHDVFEYALETNDESTIAQVATGQMAARLIRTVREQRRAGVLRRGHSVVNPRLAVLRPGQAVVLDCVVTHGLWTYRTKTGDRVGPPPRLQRTRLRTVLVLIGQTWKVAETTTPANPKC